MKPVVRELIIVEGRYDKQAVLNAVEGQVVCTDGFGIFKDAEKRALIRKLAERKGVVVLTDADSAGFLIRNHLKALTPKLKHAYIPERRGKERRKPGPSREGLLGVEGMEPEVIVAALERAGCFLSTDAPRGLLRKSDLYALGLCGCADSAAKRAKLQELLALPSRLTTNALLEILNNYYGYDAETLKKLL